MIQNVALFVTDVGVAAMIRKGKENRLSRIVPTSLIPQADVGLGLDGQLKSYMQARSVQFENVEEMSDSEWTRLLNLRYPGRRWRRWFGRTPSAIYSVVVVES